MHIESSLAVPQKKLLSNDRLLLFYRCALFLSAFLIFTIQPLFTRLVLPVLGGASIVWSINLCFFQGCLLGGYMYAHGLMRFFPLRQAVLLHIVLLVGIGATFLPIHMPLPPEDASKSILWLIRTLFTTVGFPFFILSATAPLLQSWFQNTDHPRADDPYFLYVASNWGSIAALFLFIALFEPLTTLSQQRLFWAYGFGVFTLLLSIIGVQSFLQSAPKKLLDDYLVSVSWQDRFSWMALAFVPSGLLVAVTGILSVDVSSFPLLWIFPLALYLLTFILTFAQKPFISPAFFERVHPIFALFAFIISLPPFFLRFGYFSFFFYIGIFFITAMVCHGQLVKRRPIGKDCTSFYCWLSFGSVLGALCATLLAPLLLSSALEFPILILAGLLLRSKMQWNQFFIWFPSLTLGYFFAAYLMPYENPIYFFLISLCIICVFLFFQMSLKRQGCFIGTLCAVFFIGNTISAGKVISRYRSFFGIYTITESLMEDGSKQRVFFHGSTVHGAEIIPADTSFTQKPEPVTYFYPGGSLHSILEASRFRKGALRVGIIGLGTGSLACYKSPEDQWTLFEIDPLVVAVAQKYFHFLSECAPNTPIILGDGRLNLMRHKHIYDVLLIDAFSSDGIPTHLLTREALQTYRSVLAEDGLMVFHVSNRYINLAPIIASTAQHEGLHAWRNPNVTLDVHKSNKLWFPPRVVVVSAHKENLGILANTWIPIESHTPPWTDDYANVLGALWRGWGTGS